MGSRALLAASAGLVALLTAGCLFSPQPRILRLPPAGEAEATAFLQAELDRGGRIFLPRLPGGRCYRTHGLWISRSWTELRSNGACLEALGPGPVRLRSPDGDPVRSSAVLFVSRVAGSPRPAFVSLSGLRIVVPREAMSFGIAVYGDDVHVRDVTVEGAPIDALAIGGRSYHPARDVSIERSRFVGAQRNVVSVVSAVRLRISKCVISGASGRDHPSAGIDVEPDDDLDALVDLRVEDSTIERNAGPGILFALSTDSGLPRRATAIVVARNRILGNGEGGIAFQGGQKDGRGWIRIGRNTIRRNRGAGLEGHPTEGTIMRILASRNDLRGNAGGPARFVRVGKGSRLD
jgi:hypothetical protein